MNPNEGIVRRREKVIAEISQLAYERYDLSKKIEVAEIRMEEIDNEIARREAVLVENECARRDFDTYLAIQQNAVSMDDVLKAAGNGKDLEVPPEAVVARKTKSKGVDNAK